MKYTRFTESTDTSLCPAHRDHARLSEDGKILILSGLEHRAWLTEIQDPIEKLMFLLKNYALTAIYETSAGHFSKHNETSWEGDLPKIYQKDGLFGSVLGGMSFTINFATVSAGCRLIIAPSEKQLIKDILTLIAENYATAGYKEAVVGEYARSQWKNGKHTAADYDVYFKSERGHICVASPHDIKELSGEISTRTTGTQRHFLKHAFEGAERIGNREEVCYSELLTSKLDEILNF